VIVATAQFLPAIFLQTQLLYVDPVESVLFRAGQFIMRVIFFIIHEYICYFRTSLHNLFPVQAPANNDNQRLPNVPYPISSKAINLVLKVLMYFKSSLYRTYVYFGNMAFNTTG
jgi:hypothetical protein